MTIKAGIIFFTLFVGILALPPPEYDDFEQFFEHVDPESRIVGGTITPEGSDPHMVAMSSGFILSSFLCGGSILSPRTVLTAAHCIDNVYGAGSLISSLRVTVGTNRWNRGGHTFRLSGNVTHQHYLSREIKNDIGVLYTAEPMIYSNLVQPITLSYDFVDAGIPVRAAGWGKTRRNSSFGSAELRELRMPTIDSEQCVQEVIQMAISTNMRAPPVEPHIEICTKHESGAGFGMCNGDSGSALLRLDEGTQIGVVSWGFPCARGAPDMFVRISAYQSWVAQHTRD